MSGKTTGTGTGPSSVLKSTPIDERYFQPVEKLRKSYEGMQFLRQTGRFKDYMKVREEPMTRQFVAWDGEGWTDTDGEHRYMLFMCSTGAHIQDQRLTSRDCLDAIIRVAADTGRSHHVIYGGGYDVTHILRDMPSAMRDQLLTGETEVRWFVQSAEGFRREPQLTNTYTMSYLPHKWFTLKGYDWVTRKWVRVKLFDTVTFFQSSFIDALKNYGIDVPDVISKGKARRSTFLWSDVEEVKRYCQMELEFLVMLMDQLREDFTAAGIRVTSWHGPGAVASAVLKQYGVRHAMGEAPSRDLEKAWAGAYFGGRFEQFKAGHYEGQVYQYDIRSAYPSHIANLPDLSTGFWEWVDHFEHGSFGVWHCWREPRSQELGRFVWPGPNPHREQTGAVGFPAQSEGVWLWTPEAVLPGVRITGGYVWRTAARTQPFGFVRGMYTQRQAWKAQGKGAERALKLALNSLYGKMAQRVGGSDKYGGRPAWHQLAWAGYVTSATRAQLWGAIARAGDSLIACETDAVFTTAPVDLPLSTELGDWEETRYEWISYLQSGVYWTNATEKGERPRNKTRGFSATGIEHGEVEQYFQRLTVAELDGAVADPILVPHRQFIALGNPQRHLYGQWQDGTKAIGIGAGKRVHIPALCTACQSGASFVDTLHTMSANPTFGYGESKAHDLPWLGEVIVPDPDVHIIEDVALDGWD